MAAADLLEHRFYLLVLKSGNLSPNVTFLSGESHLLIRLGGSELYYCLPDDTSWLEKEIGKNIKTI